MRAAKPPALNIPLPFDAMAFDWCPPYGKGAVADFKITCFESPGATNERQVGLEIRAENCVDGFISRSADVWSRFRYDLSANVTSDYNKVIRLGWSPTNDVKSIRDSAPSQDSYLVFRIRTATNEVGKVVRANYGIGFESLSYQSDLSMGIQVNPTTNDTSLEDDWVYKNLPLPCNSGSAR